MRAIFLIVYLFHLQVAYAQNDDQETGDVKPSWSDNMPKRQETPEMDFDASIDDEEEDIGLSRDDLFGLDDEDLSRDIVSNEEQQSNEQKSADEEKAAETQRLAEAEKMAETQRLADAEKAAETQRLADAENAAETQRLADAEKAAETQRLADAEKEAETQRLAGEAKILEQNKTDENSRIVEQQRLTEEKRVADKIKEEQRIAEQEKILEEKNRALELTEEQNSDSSAVDTEPEEIQTEVVSPVLENTASTRYPYKWKKVVNALPQYPDRAIRDKKEGWVEVEVELASNGDVVGAKVANSYRNAKTFNRAALRAVKQWKYDPPENYGITNNQFRVVRILFKL